jgi:hypothetical protein
VSLLWHFGQATSGGQVPCSVFSFEFIPCRSMTCFPETIGPNYQNFGANKGLHKRV